jgi:signal transduction histidine kinase
MSLSIKDDLDAVARISSVPTILEIVTTLTGMRFAAVARVTAERWIAMAVRDQLSFGLQPGGELALETTICNEIRQHRQPVAFNEARTHPVFSTHHTPRIHGLQSYISVPIFRGNGDFYGTLCAIDSVARNVERPEIVESLQLFAKMIAEQLDSTEFVSRTARALADAESMGGLRDQFMAVLGHDLRNPLGTMSMSTSALLYREKDPTALKLLGAMKRACDRMAELISNILDFARGQLGSGIEATLLPDAELGAALQQIVDETRIAQPDLRIVTDIRIERVVVCDRRRLAQLFGNLLSNAATHGDRTQPIAVSAATHDGVFELRVTNAGPAIPADKLARLFHPFTRGSNEGSGLGLGLHIASEIARAHGGTLTVESADGRTTFTFVMSEGAARVRGSGD